MILKVHIDGATSYEIGDEIWQPSPSDAIREEAEVIADYVGGLPVGSNRQTRETIHDQIVAAMTAALVQAGDTYHAAEGVAYSLIERPAQKRHDEDMVDNVTSSEPVIEDVLRFENLPMAGWAEAVSAGPVRGSGAVGVGVVSLTLVVSSQLGHKQQHEEEPQAMAAKDHEAVVRPGN